jgi:hypothetical protein
MGQFDQTGRQMAKLDGAAFLAWALSCCEHAPRLSWLGWDDTRRLVAPGEPDRVNDLVAQVRDEARPRRAAWLIAEIEEEAKPRSILRAGQYELLLAGEVAAECDPAGPAILSIVLNLSGTQKRRGLQWDWGGYGTRLAPLIVDAARQDALATLERVGCTTWFVITQPDCTWACQSRWLASFARTPP